MIIVSSSFFTTWVSTHYIDQEEAFLVANRILFWANLVSLPLNLGFGWLCDRVRFGATLPLTATVCALGCFLLHFSSHPVGLAAISGEVLLLNSASVLGLLNTSLLHKLCEKEG